MVKELRQTFDDLTRQSEDMFNEAKREGRELTPLECTKRDHIFADIGKLKVKLNAEKAREDAGQHFSGNAGSDERIAAATASATGNSHAQFQAEVRNTPEANKMREKYNHFLRTGDERELFTITSGTASGALIPTSVDIPDIVRRLYNSIPAAIISRGYSIIETATCATLVIPLFDDTNILGDEPSENGTSDSETDPAVSTATLGATLFSSQSIWLSNTMINTVGWDLVGYLMPLLDKRVELKEDLAWITKLLTHAAGGNTFTTALTTAFTYTELVALYHTLPNPYRSDAVWIVNDAFLQSVRNLKDSENRPLFNMLDPLVNAGAIGTLMGCPVLVSTNMPAMTANNISAVFASAECLKVRRCTNRRIARYTNIPTYPDQVGFRLFENADAAFNPAGLAYLKMAIS